MQGLAAELQSFGDNRETAAGKIKQVRTANQSAVGRRRRNKLRTQPFHVRGQLCRTGRDGSEAFGLRVQWGRSELLLVLCKCFAQDSCAMEVRIDISCCKDACGIAGMHVTCVVGVIGVSTHPFVFEHGGAERDALRDRLDPLFCGAPNAATRVVNSVVMSDVLGETVRPAVPVPRRPPARAARTPAAATTTFKTWKCLAPSPSARFSPSRF